MRFRRLFALATVLLLSACGGLEERSVADVGGITGEWTAKSGVRLDFKVDHTFTSQGLHLDPSLTRGCPSGTAGGSWGFVVAEGAPAGLVAMSKEAQRGDVIGLNFRDIPQGDCLIKLSVLKDGASLCISIDLDEVCTFKERFTRTRATPTT